VVAQFGQFGAQAYEVYSATPTDVTYAGDAFSATFTADVYGADRVRAYGMVPDQTDLDGPVWLQRQPGSDTRWTGTGPLARWGATDSYVVIVVAHRGANVIGEYVN
jgi:hypothetical protein